MEEIWWNDTMRSFCRIWVLLASSTDMQPENYRWNTSAGSARGRVSESTGVCKGRRYPYLPQSCNRTPIGSTLVLVKKGCQCGRESESTEGRRFFLPVGSLIARRIDTKHPIGHGLDQTGQWQFSLNRDLFSTACEGHA